MTIQQFFKDKKVIITGHTGFKGSWLATWLHLLGAKVTGFALLPEHDEDHFNLLQLKNRINHKVGDIRNIDQFQGVVQETKPEIIFHLAAQALVRRSYANPKWTFDTNIGGSVNVLETVRNESSVRVLVFVTSDKCYRNKEWLWGYRENDELGGDDPYSCSKACAELVLSSFMTSYFKEDSRICAASVRAGNIIGGGDWAEDRIIPDCVRAIKGKRKVNIRNPKAKRPWQHVLDPLMGYLLLSKKLYYDDDRLFTGAWNFGPEKQSNRTVDELTRCFMKACGYKLGNIRHKVHGSDYKESQLLHLNCDKAHAILGWKSVWDFDQTVFYTAEWYKQWLKDSNIWELTKHQIQIYSERCKTEGIEI